MFGGAPEPQMFNPINIPGLGGQGLTGAAMQMALPALAQGFMNQYNMVPSQFLPTQNLYDQFLARSYHQQQQQAMGVAAGRDVQSMQRTIQGAQRLMTGKAPTVAQQRQSFQMANQLQGVMPYLSMFLGPEMVEQLMGPQGSATMMAQSMHRGLRQYRDPRTGGLGVQGETAGQMATEIYEQLYGAGADIQDMRGLTAGQTGRMFEELANRGMAGPTFGELNQEDRLRQIAATSFAEGTQRRVAENRLRSEGRAVTVDSMEAMQSEIFGERDPDTGQRVAGPNSTVGRIRDAAANNNLDMRALEEFGAGTEELLSAGAAQRIGSRLKNLSGAVSAMRDIFGDMGRPNAPMRELINGLEALTQGGLASMSPAALENMVRTTEALAKRSGIGIQGFLGLQAQAANMADQFGLDRSMAVQATQASAAWGAAAKQTQRLDIPAFGGLTAEEGVLLNQQLQMQTAASQTTNMMAATVRMFRDGMVDPNSTAGRMAQALMENPGATTFTDANGVERNMAMNNGEWVRMMEASGANSSTARSVLSDQFMNQEAMRDYNLQLAGRNAQRQVDLDWRVRNTFADSLFGQFTQQGLTDLLDERNVVSRAEVGQMQKRMGERLVESYFNMDNATARNTEARNLAMGRAAQNALADEIRAAGGTEADVQAAMEQLGELDEETGVREGALEMGVGMFAQLGREITLNPNLRGYKTVTGLHQQQNPYTLRTQLAEFAEGQTEGRMRTAFSRMGRAGPITRLVGEIQRAGPDSTFGEIVARVAGGIPAEELARLEDGPVGAMLSAQREFDRAERYTEAQVRQEMLDRRAAAEAGLSLEAYQARQQENLGDDWRQQDADYINLRQRLADDAEYQAAVDAQVGVQTGQLTGRGMRQRRQAAEIVEALQVGGAQADRALASLGRQYFGAEATGAEFTDQFFETREAAATTEEERERIRDLRKMVTSLRGAREGAIVSRELEQMGYATDQSVGAGEAEGVAELGAAANEALLDLDAAETDEDRVERRQEATDASAAFLKSTKDITETIQASAKDMQQLGVEGVGALRRVQRFQSDLEELAAKAGVTPSQLVAGDLPPELAGTAEGRAMVERAQMMQAGLADAWQQVSDIKATGKMPGSEGAATTALGEREMAVIREEAEFMIGKEFMPEKVKPGMTQAEINEEIKQGQAQAVVAGLVGQMGGAESDKFITPEGELTRAGKELQRLVSDTGRAQPIKRALAARKQLMRMAAQEELATADGKKMTEAQLLEAGGEKQQEAISLLREQLESGQLDEDKAREARRLFSMQEPLRDIGQRSLDYQGMESRIEQFRGVSRAADDAKKESGPTKLQLINSTVRILNPEAMQLAGDMAVSDTEHNDVNTTMMGNLLPGMMA